MSLWVQYAEEERAWQLWQGQRLLESFNTLDEIEQEFSAAMANVLGSAAVHQESFEWPPAGVGTRLS